MSRDSYVPYTFAALQHCIKVICKQAITRSYLPERIGELESANHQKTPRFVRLYGDAHRRKVAVWFNPAGAELGMSDL